MLELVSLSVDIFFNSSLLHIFKDCFEILRQSFTTGVEQVGKFSIKLAQAGGFGIILMEASGKGRLLVAFIFEFKEVQCRLGVDGLFLWNCSLFYVPFDLVLEFLCFFVVVSERTESLNKLKLLNLVL